MSVIDFLTGGVFISAKDLFINILQYIIRFFMNLGNIFLTPLINIVFSELPDFAVFNSMINQFLSYITPFINFILDAIFLTTPVITYLFISVIVRVLLKSNGYLAKLIIKWYHQLAP